MKIHLNALKKLLSLASSIEQMKETSIPPTGLFRAIEAAHDFADSSEVD